MRGVVFAVGIVKSLKAKRGFSKDTGEGLCAWLKAGEVTAAFAPWAYEER